MDKRTPRSQHEAESFTDFVGSTPETADSVGEMLGGEAATFKLLYTSRDGRLCVFEDADGHLTSVKSSRFA